MTYAITIRHEGKSFNIKYEKGDYRLYQDIGGKYAYWKFVVAFPSLKECENYLEELPTTGVHTENTQLKERIEELKNDIQGMYEDAAGASI